MRQVPLSCVRVLFERLLVLGDGDRVPLATCRFHVDDVLQHFGDLEVVGKLGGAHFGLEWVDLVEGALELVDELSRLVKFLD